MKFKALEKTSPHSHHNLSRQPAFVKKRMEEDKKPDLTGQPEHCNIKVVSQVR